MALEALPVGAHRVHSEGRTYIVTKSIFAKGGSVKIVGRELGGKDYISGNVYYLKDGATLFPCEMPREKVERFLENAQLIAEPAPD